MSAPPATSTDRPVVARRMNASEQPRAEKNPRRVVQWLIGPTGYGITLALLVGTGPGASSWNVLTEGLAHRTGL